MPLHVFNKVTGPERFLTVTVYHLDTNLIVIV